MGDEDNTDASSERQPYQDAQISNEAGLSHALPVRRSSGRHAGDLTPSPRAAQAQNLQSKDFEFVLVTDNESRRQVRRHAMRQYMRQRRLDSIARLETPRLPMGGWVSRQAMLAIASKHRAGVEGKADSVQSLTHKMRALRLINERIQTDSHGLQDGTIYAVATMAVIEVIEVPLCSKLSSMVRNRGGMRGMRASSPFLEKVLYWVDISCAPKAIYTSCLPWTGAVPDTSPESLDFLGPDVHLAIPHTQTAVESSESLCDQYRACEDFLRFFRSLHELEKAASDFPGNVSRSNAAPRVRRFTPGTQLHSILTMLPDYDHGIRDIRFIDEYTCMSCLFFLAVALYDSYRNCTNFDRYLDWLALEVQKLNPFTNPSITSVLWIFLNNGGYPQGEAGDAGERCWVVSRMVRIAKRLEWKRQGTVWDRLRQVLIDFILTQQECALGSESIDEEVLIARQRRRLQSSEYFWDEDELRREILGSQPASVFSLYPRPRTTIVV
ncbi:hypothetical protein CDV55_106158 [Aspergillus turcosus]|nr:hypothetical protein CDV55_106158 [Aspergillus turcosus]